MGIFSSLENLGLGKADDMDVFGEEKKKKEAAAVAAATAKKPAEISEADFILDKTYPCPVCGQNFKAKAIKAGKAQLDSTESDLRPRYKGIDPLKYDAIVCPSCGYGALSRFFKDVSVAQERAIKAEVTSTFKGLNDSGKDSYTYEDAFVRHQIALVNAVVKKSKTSERAYICLKTAWIIRGMGELLKPETPNYEQLKAEYEKEEKNYIIKAFQGFTLAFSQENFPMCGMDENTTTYLLAELARRSGDYEKAAQMVSRVITSKTATDRLKERARELKEKLK